MNEEKINVSFKKCCICDNSIIGEFTIINGKKYHWFCIEKLQQENTQLKQDVEKLAHNMTVQDIYNSKIVQQLKDKDEKISNLIKLLIEMVFDDINDLGVYQELVARHLVKLGYIVKEDGFYKELETNKED